MKFCNCTDCKKARRKGLVIGTRYMGFWIANPITKAPEYYYGPVSDYVHHPKFASGRRIKQRYACDMA